MTHQTPVAAMDLGSNTFRLMLAEKRAAGWSGKKVWQHIPRLSEQLTPGGHLAPEAVKRAWRALEEFDALIRAAGAARVLAGATMAARLAADGPEFMAALRDRFGWETVILTGEQEGLLTARGVLAGLAPPPARGMIFDIGGRSTEFIATAGRDLLESRSLAVGVVGLTETFLADDPPTETQLAAVTEAVRAVLRAEGPDGGRERPLLVGTAGTVTTMAALLLNLTAYDPEQVNNARLPAADIRRLLQDFCRITIAERVARYGLPPLRADAMAAGLILALEIMAHFRQETLTVSDNGLLEGLWLQAAGCSH